jgi:phosphatidylglycerol:prolipoprotein diacylglycerol transferase
MYPILDRYGPFFLYSFTVVMGLGILAGIGLTAALERWKDQEYPDWIDGALIGLMAGIIGGRIIFVWLNWTYYQVNPGEIGLVWRGGLSYHGAILAGLLALWAWSSWRGFDFGRYAGLLAPAIALASAFGWLACWLEGCAYGRETVFGPLAADLPDSFGVFGLRYQTQWMGLAFCLAVFFLILGFRRRVRPVVLFWLTLLLLSGGRVVVSIYRGDVAPMVRQFRLDTLVDAALILLSLTAIVIAALRQSKLTAES